MLSGFNPWPMNFCMLPTGLKQTRRLGSFSTKRCKFGLEVGWKGNAWIPKGAPQMFRIRTGMHTRPRATPTTHTHTHTHTYTSLMDRIRDPTSVLIICHLDVPGSFCCGATEMNPTNTHEGVGSIPSLALWARKPAWVLP